MSELQGSKFFVTVHNCRLCGCVIPIDEGARKHTLVCRLPLNAPRDKFEQMTLAKFPCPLVTLERIPIPVTSAGKMQTCSSSGHVTVMKSTSTSTSKADRHRRQSSLRALDIMSRSFRDTSGDEGDNVTNRKRQRRERKTKKANGSSDPSEAEPEHEEGKVVRLIRTKAWGRTIFKKITVDEETHKFLCPVTGCGARLKRAHQLKLHFIMHLENNPFACPVPGCITRCGTHFHFHRHIGWHMGRNIISCERCGQTCADKTRLKRHLNKCNSERFFEPHQRKIISLEGMTKILKSHYVNLESKGLLMKMDDDLEQACYCGSTNEKVIIIKED